MRTKASGFTLIELLIVVAIIGVLAAIAIPNLIIAMHRAKQKRTMSDMRNIAIAWEARASDVGRYNAAGAQILATMPCDLVQLQTYLEPTYIKDLPVRDAWGTPFRGFLDAPLGDSSATAANYTIVSAGRDQQFADPQVLGPFENYDCDLIYANGVFESYPEGFGH
jgi:general secretion pathway protein G